MSQLKQSSALPLLAQSLPTPQPAGDASPQCTTFRDAYDAFTTLGHQWTLKPGWAWQAARAVIIHTLRCMQPAVSRLMLQSSNPACKHIARTTQRQQSSRKSATCVKQIPYLLPVARTHAAQRQDVGCCSCCKVCIHTLPRSSWP
jgi:hypothetical protein